MITRLELYFRTSKVRTVEFTSKPQQICRHAQCETRQRIQSNNSKSISFNSLFVFKANNNRSISFLSALKKSVLQVFSKIIQVI
jgi:hypothetical protein